MLSVVSSIKYRLPMCRIPQELVDFIIDLIASPTLDDVDGRLHRTDTLQACTLVSKAWFPRARKHIFQRVHLRMEPASVEAYLEDDFKRFWLSAEPPTYPTFLSSFRDTPRKPWVEELVVMDLTTKTRAPFMEAMSSMVRVRSITFGGGSPFDDSPQLGGGAHFIHVRHLRLQNISIPSLDTLPLILESMPMLESFTVIWPITFLVYPADEPSSPKKAIINNRLDLVDISSCPPPIDHLLLALFTLTSITKLIISPTLSFDDDVLALGVLEIDHTHRHLPTGIRAAFPFYDVPKVVLRLTREAELELYIQVLEDVVAHARVGMRSVMHELHVHILSESESEYRVWERLDAGLNNMVGLGFSRLIVSCPSKGGLAIKKAMTTLGTMLILNVISPM